MVRHNVEVDALVRFDRSYIPFAALVFEERHVHASDYVVLVGKLVQWSIFAETHVHVPAQRR